MIALFEGPKVDVLTSSGMLRVTICPTRQAGLATLGFDVVFAAILYHYWAASPLFFRGIWIFVLASALVGAVYEFFGEEVIEINSQTLTIRKGIHGWERQREYQIAELSNLEWQQGQKGGSYLTCKVGRWPIKFGARISESAAIEILSSLQRTLPDVAQQICAYPGGKEHFITLGLTKR